MSSAPGDAMRTEALLTIDPYLTGDRAAGALPSFGTADVWGYGYADFSGDHQRGFNVVIAPFLASWMQVGTELERFTFDYPDGGRTGAYSANGFVRLYAPIQATLIPFAQGFAESSSFDGNGPSPGLTSYGAVGGIRHFLGQGAALDVGVRWRRHPDASFGSVTYRFSDVTTLEARVLTTVRLFQDRRR